MSQAASFKHEEACTVPTFGTHLAKASTLGLGDEKSCVHREAYCPNDRGVTCICEGYALVLVPVWGYCAGCCWRRHLADRLRL